MPQTLLNTDPIFAGAINLGQGGAVLGPSANTAQDGTGANVTVIFTAGTSGSFVDSVLCKAVGSPAATVIRVFYCSATGTITPGTTNTAANTTLIAEQATQSWTSSNTTASPQYEIPIRKFIPASTKLLIAFGTSTGAAGTGFAVTTFAGDY